jgi:hypothetical protein
MKHPNYYRTDHYELFLGSLRSAERQVLRTEIDVQQIPWAILAVHMVVQMSCIVALDERDTTRTACLSDQKVKGGKTLREKTVELMHAQRFDEMPEAYLASPASLLKRVQDKSDVMGPDAFRLDDETTWHLRILNESRDSVVHLLPSSWSLELTGMPEIFKSAFELALLTVRAPGIYRHRLPDSDRTMAEEICNRIISKLNGGIEYVQPHDGRIERHRKIENIL